METPKAGVTELVEETKAKEQAETQADSEHNSKTYETMAPSYTKEFLRTMQQCGHCNTLAHSDSGEGQEGGDTDGALNGKQHGVSDRGCLRDAKLAS